MSIPFCTCDPLVYRDCECSRPALLISTNAPCRCSRGSTFTRCEVQKYPPKLLTDLCLPRPCSSGKDFKSRKQDSLQADQLGQDALLVMLSPLSVPLLPSNLSRFCTGLVLPLHPEAYRAETQELVSPSLPSCRPLSYGKKSCPTALVLNVQVDSG